MKDLSKEIRAYALKNAIDFEKADPGKILPKLFQHGLEKSEIKNIMPLVQQIVKEVNSLSNEDRKKQFDNYFSIIPVKEEKEHELSELPNNSKHMVFRLAPFPSGALHIGNAKTYLLNALYAEKYKAKILLVMDDTIGSAEKQIAPEAYKLIEDAFKWLGVKYKKPVIYKSDRLHIYYKYAEKLIKKDKAYVCYCSKEKLRENRAKGLECSCREMPINIQLKRWKEMFNMKEGDASLRIKTNMMHPNPAFRDRVLFKISDRKHPRVKNKYRVWPTLEMSWAIDDHLLGITHILRGIDLQIETDMEKYIWDIFSWKAPETLHTGLLTLEGIESKISKSKAQKEVKSGQFTGWDDPRTWSVQSLKRRGIKSEAIKEFIKEIGLNKQDISAPIDSLYSINRKLIDSDSDRYSFVSSPVEIKIENALKIKEVKVPVHPDKNEKREIEVKKIFISQIDFEKFKGQEIRLLHLYNIKIDKNEPKALFISEENKDIPKINWVSEPINCQILMPDGSWITGFAEPAIKNLKKNEVIQFERFGFCKFDTARFAASKKQILGAQEPKTEIKKVLDKKEKNKYQFWFAHK